MLSTQNNNNPNLIENNQPTNTTDKYSSEKEIQAEDILKYIKDSYQIPKLISAQEFITEEEQLKNINLRFFLSKSDFLIFGISSRPMTFSSTFLAPEKFNLKSVKPFLVLPKN